jgi:hypothetical protein
MRVQAVAPDDTWVQCSIHREALAAKGMQLEKMFVKTLK